MLRSLVGLFFCLTSSLSVAQDALDTACLPQEVRLRLLELSRKLTADLKLEADIKRYVEVSNRRLELVDLVMDCKARQANPLAMLGTLGSGCQQRVQAYEQLEKEEQWLAQLIQGKQDIALRQLTLERSGYPRCK